MCSRIFRFEIVVVLYHQNLLGLLGFTLLHTVALATAQ
jgi:hypothetical protein